LTLSASLSFKFLQNKKSKLVTFHEMVKINNYQKKAGC